VSVPEILATGGFVITIATIVYHIGSTSEQIRQTQQKAKEQADGIGRKCREIETRQERRWKHQIATAVETSSSLEEAKQYAKLLREDAWRD
jgi:hypothetical protein